MVLFIGNWLSEYLNFDTGRSRPLGYSASFPTKGYWCGPSVSREVASWTIEWRDQSQHTAVLGFFFSLSSFNCIIIAWLEADKLYCVIMHLLTFAIFGRPFVKRFALCYQTICLSVLSCLWHWCTVAKRLDGSRWNLSCRWASAPATLC